MARRGRSLAGTTAWLALIRGLDHGWEAGMLSRANTPTLYGRGGEPAAAGGRPAHTGGISPCRDS